MDDKLQPREILVQPSNLACICPETDCEWHGNCRDCVALHRYHATLPNCLEIEIERKKGIDVGFINRTDDFA